MHAAGHKRSIRPVMPADVLVTGSSGFIGRHLVSKLAASGRNVIAVDVAAPDERLVESGTGTVTAVQCDLLNYELQPLLNPDIAVVHLAAIPGVRDSWGSTFRKYADHNILLTQRILESSVRAGVRRFVIASSSSVYGNLDSNELATEDSNPRPASPYGVSKLASELLALAYADRSDSVLRTVALRYFTVYGPGQRKDMLIARLIDSAFSGRTVDVFGNGSQTRDFTYVSDVVEATELAIDADVGSQVLNIAGGRSFSIADAIQLVESASDRKVRVRGASAQAGDVGDARANTARARELLKWSPRVSLHEGIRRQLAARNVSMH